jgi:hypothetical protein
VSQTYTAAFLPSQARKDSTAGRNYTSLLVAVNEFYSGDWRSQKGISSQEQVK